MLYVCAMLVEKMFYIQHCFAAVNPYARQQQRILQQSLISMHVHDMVFHNAMTFGLRLCMEYNNRVRIIPNPSIYTIKC